MELLIEAKRPPLEVLTILQDAVKFAERKAPKGVTVTKGQSQIFFTGDGNSKKDLLKLKTEVGKYLMSKYKHRKFKHDKARGYKVWRTNLGDLRVGIKIDRTDDETKSIILGPVKGHNY